MKTDRSLPRFHSATPLCSGDGRWLEAEAAHHAVRVTRLEAGDALILFDGSGGQYPATISVISKRGVQVDIGPHQAIERESPLAITLLQALPAGDKMDWVVQKAVELGVARIVPVACERSLLKLSGERAEKRQAHWQKVAIAGCEQSGRNRLPEITPVQRLPAALATLESGGERWILHPEGGQPLGAGLSPGGINALHLLVGPEGGFAEPELAAAKAAGFSCITLGPRILRTETAGLALLAAAQAMWGDWR